MKCVRLRLEGPLQAWSTQSRFRIRDTDREPSKSGILGLVASALGIGREDEQALAELAELKLAVRVDRPGTLLRDYQTAGGGRFRGSEYLVAGASDCVPTERFLLQDASFVAALAGEDCLVDRIEKALRSPRWPLFFGRRACVPSVPILIDVVDMDAPAAARSAPLATPTREREALRLLVEVKAGEGGELRYDVPLSFAEGDRRYAARHVRTEWVLHPEGAEDGR